MSVSHFADRLKGVRDRIVAAARAAGRDPDEVALIAVSKLQPPEAIREACAAGLRDFGENYVQELLGKAEQLGDMPGLRFHLIGHLQRNKVRQVVGVVACIHTVDSLRLVEELDRQVAARCSEPLPVLVEVNVGRESQKSGCAPDELGALLSAIGDKSGLRLRGLMTVPPFSDVPQESRPYFDELARLREQHGGARLLPELSMGMTADLEYAIQAGATMVRVGTALFGERLKGSS